MNKVKSLKLLWMKNEIDKTKKVKENKYVIRKISPSPQKDRRIVWIKNTLKTFDDFKNKQQKCMK